MNIVVERCILRVVRTGGFSWGPDPQRLLAAATRALPSLVASSLAALTSQDDALSVDRSHVVARVPVRLSEIAALATTSPESAEVRARLEARVGVALARAVGAAALAVEVGGPSDARGASPSSVFESGVKTRVRGALPSERERLFERIMRWHEGETLTDLLATMSSETLEVWHAALVANPSSSSGAPSSSTMAAFGHILASRTSSAPQDRASRIRHRIEALASIGVTHHVSSNDQAIVRALDAAVPLAPRSAATAESSAASDARSTSTSPATGGAHASSARADVPASIVSSTPRADVARSASNERCVVSALPFLILGALSRMGWLDALDATLAASGNTSRASLFASALAYKLAPPPERGWRHSRATHDVAAAFAGLETEPQSPSIADLARRLGPVVSALDALVTRELVRGHVRGGAVLLQRVADAWILVEVDGLFIVAISSMDDFAPIAKAALALGEPLLVPGGCASPELLDRLDLLNLRFITDARPSRRESWRALPRSSGGPRAFTNDTSTPARALTRLARVLSEAADDAAGVADALLVARRVAPLSTDVRFEHSVTLAASVGLASIAHTLFRERESPHPILALDRFQNLDARVRYDDETVSVRIPLGRRHADLLSHGFLSPIARVPWLGGRALTISGG